MLDALKEYWYFAVLVAGGIFKGIQLLWKDRVAKTKDISYAVDQLLDAKNIITKLTMESINKEGETAELYKGYQRMRSECPECFETQMKRQPKWIQEKILKNIGQ